MPILRSTSAEFAGTALLLTLIVGSGTQVERLGSDPTAQLLAHAVAVGAGLAVLVAVFLPVSGSQFNPVVTLVAWATGAMPRRLVPYHLVAQVLGAFTGVAVANLTFGGSAFAVATTDRSGFFGAEALATFSLVLAIFGLVRAGRTEWLPAAVGGIVAAGMLATASTGFANPAVAVARTLTDSYTGIAPNSVAPFVAAQLVGGALAGVAAIGWWPGSAGEHLDDHDPERPLHGPDADLGE
jgi:glycerol uptake facilitator-like aquaporin